MKNKMVEQLLRNASEKDKETITMALLFQKLNSSQQNYVATLSEGMIVANELAAQN